MSEMHQGIMVGLQRLTSLVLSFQAEIPTLGPHVDPTTGASLA